MLPRSCRAEIRDLETGLVFQVRRYAGSDHADVGPLTAADTEVLDAAAPAELASWVLAAVVHEERAALRHTAGRLEPADLIADLFRQIGYMSIERIHEVEREESRAKVEVTVVVYYRQPDPGVGYRKTFSLEFRRRDGAPGREIDLRSSRPLLAGSPAAGAGHPSLPRAR